MPKFVIAYTYRMSGEFIVEAESLEKAKEIVEDDDDKCHIQNEDEYVDGSFVINPDDCHEEEEE